LGVSQHTLKIKKAARCENKAPSKEEEQAHASYGAVKRGRTGAHFLWRSQTSKNKRTLLMAPTTSTCLELNACRNPHKQQSKPGRDALLRPQILPLLGCRVPSLVYERAWPLPVRTCTCHSERQQHRNPFDSGISYNSPL